MSHKKAHDINDRERTKDIQIEENVDFDSMYLSESVLSGLKASGFERPSPIQLAAIPLGRCGLDMVVQAKSGTGKTCVFTVVALEMVSVSALTTQVLVLTPTREIAVQVTQVINSIGSKLQGLRAFTFIGGMHLSLDKAKLQCCHIAVGTPGRITQLIEMRLLRLENIRLLILDEADQLLAGQFANGVVQIASGLPLNKQVITLSATYTEDVAKVAEGLMRSPNHVRLGKDSPALLGVDQYVKMLPHHRQPHRRQQAKFVDLLSILSKVTFNQCLVFSNSQLRAESVCNKLRASGWPVSFLTGGQAQSDRLIALDALCSYKCRVLVSTDLSARGLDSEHVNLVINLDMPRDHATYLHRVGRAGRFGSRGCAITLATEGDEWLAMKAISSLANVHICILKDDWVPDIGSSQDENVEYIGFLSDDELSQFLVISSSSSKLKSKKESEKNGKIDKALSGALNEKCVKKMNNYGRENVDDDSGNVRGNNVAFKKNSRDNARRSRKQELRRMLEEEIGKVKSENANRLLNALKRLNFEQSSPSFSFDNVMTEVSDKYSQVSAYDNPVINLSSLPERLDLSDLELKALKDHLKSVEEDHQEVIVSIDESFKDLSFDIGKALQGRMEGEELAKFLEKSEGEKGREESLSAIESVNGVTPGNNDKTLSHISKDSSVRKFESDGSEDDSQLSTGNQNEHASGVSPNYRVKRNQYKQNTEDVTNVRKNRAWKDKYKVEEDSSQEDVQARATDEGLNDYGYYDSCIDNENYNGYRNNPYVNADLHGNYQEGLYGNQEGLYGDQGGVYRSSLYGDQEGINRSSLAMYQKYIDSAEKFAAMMDYVQTMGKMSSWIARDYHSKMYQKE